MKEVTDSMVQRFYNSSAWKMLRQSKLNENPLRQACQMSGIITSATGVHHMKPIRLFWDERFEIKFLLSLCTPCHTAIEDDVRTEEAMGG